MEWDAFYSIEPFGEAREDIRAGIIASVISNSFERLFSSYLKNYKPHFSKVRDFMPKFEESQDSQKMQMAQAKAAQVAFGLRAMVDQILAERKAAGRA